MTVRWTVRAATWPARRQVESLLLRQQKLPNRVAFLFFIDCLKYPLQYSDGAFYLFCIKIHNLSNQIEICLINLQKSLDKWKKVYII